MIGMDDRLKLALVLFAILVLALGMRILFLVRGKFLSVATMAAVLTMKQAIANGYVIHTDPLAGFPTHPYAFPEKGLVYFAILAYRIMPFLGLFGTMYMIETLFVILAFSTVYLFARKITGRAEAGVLATLLYAVSQIGIHAGAFNRWKGDSFVPVLLVFSVLMLMYLLETEKGRKMRRILLLSAVLAPLALSVGIWNGGAYAIAAFAFVMIAIALGNFMKRLRPVILSLCCLLALGWIVIIATPIHNTIQLGLVDASLNGFGNSVVQMFGQFEPLAYLQAPAYNNPILYPIWIAVGFLASFALLFVTAIRFPFKDSGNREKRTYIAVVSMLLFGIPFALISPFFDSLIYLPLSIMAGCSIVLVSKKARQRMLLLLMLVIPMVLAFASYQIIYTSPYVGMDASFHNYLLFVEKYTPPNATILNFNGDGTAIQYWANRTTYTDTNMADSQADVTDYYNFLYARAGNFTYLKKIHPDYLLIHQVPAVGNYWNSFNGSNIQYFIEWPFMKHHHFIYDGVSLTLVYANFSSIYINKGIVLYKLTYNNT